MQGSSPVLLLYAGSYTSLITGCLDSVEWNGGLDWTGMVEWNGMVISWILMIGLTSI